jgi:Fur family ferric uptake transcriptional regulator
MILIFIQERCGALTQRKLSMTRQRRVILRELQKVTTHPTADQVYAMVRKEIPHVSLATVYRNLDLLARAGLILKLETAGAQMRFDGNPAGHYHIRCIRCHRVDDLPAGAVMVKEEEVGAKTGYRITGHHLEYKGLCPACQAEGQNTKA